MEHCTAPNCKNEESPGRGEGGAGRGEEVPAGRGQAVPPRPQQRPAHPARQRRHLRRARLLLRGGQPPLLVAQRGAEALLAHQVCRHLRAD